MDLDGPRRGARDNGLRCSGYVAVADFDPRIADALLRLYGPSAENHELKVAHHLIEAGPVAQTELVFQFACRAGDRALALFAWNDSARYFDAR